MDAGKLWRCQQFFLRGLLKDRRYSYAIRAYQTDKDAFMQLYTSVRHTGGFADYFRIEGTFVPRVQPGQPAAKTSKGRRKPSNFLVHFAPIMSDTTFGKRPAEGLIEYMAEHDITRLFLVSPTMITAQGKQVLAAAVTVEYWPMLACLSEAELHYTVPRCRRLSVKEKRAFYAAKTLTHSNMSRMLVSERVARYWDFQPGDLIDIERQTHVGILQGEKRVVVHA
jgi:DNA-directed RNA polymerase subunit H (RpoH/RPB5)